MNLQYQVTENLFELLNLTEHTFQYRKAPIDLPCIPGEEDDYHRQLNKIALKVGRETKGPALIIRDTAGIPYVAVPANRRLADNFKVNTSPSVVRLTLRSEVHKVNFLNCNDQEWSLLSRFLEFEIRKQIKDTGNVVEDLAGRFFIRKGLKGMDTLSVALMPGFSFRIVAEGLNKAYICLDVTSRYVEKTYLSKKVNYQNVTIISKRLLAGRKKGFRCLYTMGDNWFPIDVIGFGTKKSGDEILDNGQSLHKYVKEKTAGNTFSVENLVSEEDAVVYYRYPGNKDMKPMSAPASLVKRQFKTGDREVKGLHSKTILETDFRFNLIMTNLKRFFSRLKFMGKPLFVASKPLQRETPVFPLKPLKFNNQKILFPYPKGLPAAYDYPLKRRSFLESNGILDQSGFDTQYLVIPDSMTMPQKLLDNFKSRFIQQVQGLNSSYSGFRQVVRISGNVTLPATDYVDLMVKTLQSKGITEGYALIVIPNFGDDKKTAAFHHLLKKRLYPNIKFQFVDFEMIRSFYEYTEDENGKWDYHQVNNERAKLFKSYLFYLSLGYLKANHKYPYALAERPNYDVYIAIDVHERYAGYVFFYLNGEQIYFDYQEVDLADTSQRAEKLSEEKIYTKLYANLKKHLERKYCVNPNGIILLRDGISHGGEERALKRVIKDLKNDRLIEHENLLWAVMDLHKTSRVPFRIGSNTNQQKRYDRPAAGSYRMLGRQFDEVFIFPTGQPFSTKGSSKPIHLTKIAGNADFLKISEDVFSQCLLAFSAPDRPSGLPVPIALLDELLQPLAVSKKIEHSDEEEVTYLDDELENDSSRWDEHKMAEMQIQL
ncbi:hypothetical protein [Runella aurantiaca]|uniref:Piwi domain-containing protein n=1 Tax=Runella aurantiaca TaxID=2282308 RepID=A0A369IDF0_9BACT|nr:hypothetical protein [Runella aurantiaca]RDB07799.1 hypothetical protein DVG78_01720 [Runella aurantiaca]